MTCMMFTDPEVPIRNTNVVEELFQIIKDKENHL